MVFSEESFDKNFTLNADILVSVHKFHHDEAENGFAKLRVNTANMAGLIRPCRAYDNKLKSLSNATSRTP